MNSDCTKKWIILVSRGFVCLFFYFLFLLLIILHYIKVIIVYYCQFLDSKLGFLEKSSNHFALKG